MLHRQYVNGTVQDRIYKRTVLHVDAWIYQMRDDQLYLLIEEREAGVSLAGPPNVYRIEPNGALYPVALGGDIHRQGLKRHCDSPWARKYAPWLNRIHREQIQPQLRIPREGYTFICVKLHYVYTDTKLCDPMEGIENMYAATGRAIRDASLRTPETDALNATIKPTPRANPAWGKRDRSVLRTLDKLLK